MMSEEELIEMFKNMFDCDEARIESPLGKTMFLIIGDYKSTEDSEGQWYKNGKPHDFKYLDQITIASGETKQELIKDARHYKRIQNMDWGEYLEEVEGIEGAKEKWDEMQSLTENIQKP